MVNNEDIKELLEKKKLQQIFFIALSNSLKLTLTSTYKGKDKISNIETEINLLKGLTTKISDQSLLSNNNVLKFHQKQVANVYEIWEKNRETLVKVLQIIAGNSEDDFTDFELNSSPQNRLNYKENQEYEETIRDDDEENWIDDIENETPESENQSPKSENFEDTSLDLEMVSEEEIFTDENKEDIEDKEENWDDFMDEMPEKEEIVTKEEVVINSDGEDDSPSLEVSDDWQEWLEEDNSSNNNGEHEPQAIDWSEEDWQEEEEII